MRSVCDDGYPDEYYQQRRSSTVVVYPSMSTAYVPSLVPRFPLLDAMRLLEILRLVQQTLQFGNPSFQVRNMPFLVSAKNVHELDLCLQRHLF